MIQDVSIGNTLKVTHTKVKILGKNEETLLTSGIQMPRNQLTKDELKVRVLDLKKKLEREPYSEGIRFLADSYVNKVLDIIEEYRY